MNRKAAWIAMTLALGAVSGAAFAQTATQPMQPAQQTQNANATDNTQTVAQWTSPDDMHSDVTRAQVDRDYMHAKNDGQLQYLNSTLYAHH
ncbi:hypothetical protein [Paraburkholderia phosphatilytica]|uniref:hypothetical protein n=1 Tax=Paraburkholderia phosphatilytica TaxID=2282883 RepID=UPI000E4671C1|nr:hypothetical protein [Paraburkholderia phosphatilytica]